MKSPYSPLKVDLTFYPSEMIEFLKNREYSIYVDVRTYKHWDNNTYELRIPIPYKNGSTPYNIKDEELKNYHLNGVNILLEQKFIYEFKTKLLERDKRTIIVQ